MNKTNDLLSMKTLKMNSKNNADVKVSNLISEETAKKERKS